MQKKIFIFLFILFSSAGWSSEITSCESSNETTLKQLIEGTIENNPELKEAWHTWRAKRSDIISDSALKDPMVTFSKSQEPTQTRTGKLKGTFSISQTLPFPGKQKTKIRSLNIAANAKYVEYEIRVRNTIIQVKKLFAEMWFLQNAIELSQKSVELISKMATMSLADSKTSPSDKIAILKAQSQLAQVGNDQLVFQERLEVKKAWLKALTGLEVKKIAALPEFSFNPEIAELAEKALHERQEIKKLKLLSEKARAMKRLANLEGKPDFTVGYTEGRIGQRPDLSGIDIPGEGKNTRTFFLSMNLPIWRTKNRAKNQKANQDFLAAKSRLESLKRNTEAEIKEAVFKYKNLVRMNQLYKETIVPQAKKAIDEVETEYHSSNVSSIAQYLDAQILFYATNMAWLKNITDSFIALADLEKKLGFSPIAEQGD